MTSAGFPTIHQHSGMPSCLICGETLVASLAKGKKSGQPFIMLRCKRDGRHYRAFISDKKYVSQVLEHLEAAGESQEGGQA